jgi:hypothetical protein
VERRQKRNSRPQLQAAIGSQRRLNRLYLYKAYREGTFCLPCTTDGLAWKRLKNYRPTEKEPFMNDRQRDYFRDEAARGRTKS